MSRIKANSRGFTLVELSIVLVIIGLLVGGLLIAQSMISTASITSAVKTVNQYEIAIGNFKTKFRQLPGDSNIFLNGSGNPGNNNGTLDADDEYYGAWAHLSQGVSLKNSQGTDYVPWASGDFTYLNAPRLPFSNQWGDDPVAPNILLIGGLGDYFGADPYIYYAAFTGLAAPLTAKDTLAWDKKFDDGLPASGNVQADNVGEATPTPCRTGTCPGSDCAYDLSTNYFACYFVQRLTNIN